MNIAICDDDQRDLDHYGEKIRAFAESAGEPADIRKFDSAERLLFALSEASEAAELLFLDVNMPGTNGILLAEKMKKLGYSGEIVFLTVSTDHMLSAFDVGAYNYIVKDHTTDERFERVVRSAIASAKKKSNVFMLFSAGGENRNVPVADILYFEVAGRIIAVHYGDETFEFFSTLGKLENKLRNYGFIRIHRSILVAKAYIRKFSYDEVVLTNGEKLPVSRGSYARLKETM